MRISLNGNEYELKVGTSVSRSPMVEWPENTRLDGQQKRKDRSNLSTWAYDDWSGGLGIERMNLELASHQYRLWDAENVDTRWPGFICLAPLYNVCTLVPSVSNSEVHSIFKVYNNFYGICPGNRGGVCHQFTPPFTMGSKSTLFNNDDYDNAAGLDFVGGQFHCAGRFDADACWLTTGTLGAAPVNLGTLDHVIPGGVRPQFADLRGTYHCLFVNSDQDKVKWFVGYSATMSLVATSPCLIASYSAPLESTGSVVYANLPQGIYEFTSNPRVLVNTARSADRHPSQVLYWNKLYFKNKYSLFAYDDSDVQSVGYDQDEGLPNDKMGEITCQESSNKFQFAAIKGGTYSHILAMDKNYAWHYYARIPSAGRYVTQMRLTDAPDGIDRLFCLLDNGTTGYFLNPIVNPLQAGTYAFVPTGHFTLPIFDGGIAEEPGAFFERIVNGDGLGESNKITCYYGLNGNNPTVTLGVVATTNLPIMYGSPYGVEGYRMQAKFMLTGSPAGSTPLFRNSIEHYLKQPDTREMFDFVIDLKATASDVRPVEAIIGSLNYERDRKPLMPFWYGQVPTKRVKVLNMPGLDEVNPQNIMNSERDGVIQVRVAEII